MSKAHFLNPNARRVNRSLGDATGLTGLGFHLIKVEPNHETTEVHVHHYEDECVYVLAGEATAVIGDAEHAIGLGDFIGYRKGGLAHTIRNTGSTILRCIVVGERLPHDVCDYPDKGKRLFRIDRMDWNVVDRDAIENPKAGAKT
ncbi:cupin domain-containing protein [Rhizobiaceae bacterium]|nr:cupin domain-containing protein [Rhizobiaceae bacterium]